MRGGPNNTNEGRQGNDGVVLVVSAEDAAALAEALNKIDPVDFHGGSLERFQRWLGLLTACKFGGITRDAFIAWSTRDPTYANDGPTIARMWASAKPEHAGLLHAALSERGIKVRAKPSRATSHTHYIIRDPSFAANSNPGVPSPKAYPRRKTIYWPGRVANATANIHQRPDDDTLYAWACVVAETHFECGKPTRAFAEELLEKAAWKLIRERGIDAVRRTIRRAFDHVSRQMKEVHMKSSDIEMKEKQALVGSKTNFTSYRDAALTSLTLEAQAGRFANETVVVGSRSGPIYPNLPEGNPWSSDPVPPEEPLGWSVEAQEPTGEPFEIAASELARASAVVPHLHDADATATTTDVVAPASDRGTGAVVSTEAAAPTLTRRKFV
jgi:hypothetical protein